MEKIRAVGIEGYEERKTLQRDAGETILDALADARIFSCGLSDDRSHMELTECCDGHFGADLTAAEVDELISALTAMRQPENWFRG